MTLRYCSISPLMMGHCCTPQMETKMATQSRVQLERFLSEQVLKICNILNTKASKFNDIFQKLLAVSKTEFHNMFTRTYGIIYQQNAYVFSNLFEELENYYKHGRVDLLDVMDKFFSNLYQKMFKVLNSEYIVDDKYLHCVGQHMKELKPFGDVPDKLSVQIKRSFVATRSYSQALKIAAKVIKRLINNRLSNDCIASLTRMQYCGKCNGYTAKPCLNYCLNVVDSCTQNYHEFIIEWENYADAMDKVADRLLGSFNIVMVVEPINIKISDAIMNFQDSGKNITSRVFQGCGQPASIRHRRTIFRFKSDAQFSKHQTRLNENILSPGNEIDRGAYTNETSNGDFLDIDATVDDDMIVLRERRSAIVTSLRHDTKLLRRGSGGRSPDYDLSDYNHNNNRGNRKINRKHQTLDHLDRTYNNRDPPLDKIVRDIRHRVKDLKNLFSNLSQHFCDNHNTNLSSTEMHNECWNGPTLDRYPHLHIDMDSDEFYHKNFRHNEATPGRVTQIRNQVSYLRNVINHLRNAYNGQDVEWTEEGKMYFGSGSNSGFSEGTNDTEIDADREDDDDENDNEGSGISNAYVPAHTSHYTEQPYLHQLHKEENTNSNNDKGIMIGETHVKAMENTDDFDKKGSYNGGISIQMGKSQKPLDVNQWEEKSDNNNDVSNNHNHNNVDNNIGQHGHFDTDIDYKSTAECHGRCVINEMSLRRAFVLYLVPMYITWLGGMIHWML